MWRSVRVAATAAGALFSSLHIASADTVITYDEWFLSNGSAAIQSAGYVSSFSPPLGCTGACTYGWTDAITIDVYSSDGTLLASANVDQFQYLNEYSETHSFPVDTLIPPNDAVTAQIINVFDLDGGGGPHVDICCDLEPLSGPPSETPLPGAVPLFATVLAGIGLLVWRRSRMPRRTSESAEGAEAEPESN